MRLVFTKTAQKDLDSFNPITQKQIAKKLKFILEQPEPLKFAVKLSNLSRGGDYRFRIGVYRVVFDAAGDTIIVLYIEHRREVYRRR